MMGPWEVRYGDARYTSDLATFDCLQDAVTFYNTEVRTMKFCEYTYRVYLMAPYNRIHIRTTWNPRSQETVERIYLSGNLRDTNIFTAGHTPPLLTVEDVEQHLQDSKQLYPWPGEIRSIDNPPGPRTPLRRSESMNFRYKMRHLNEPVENRAEAVKEYNQRCQRIKEQGPHDGLSSIEMWCEESDLLVDYHPPIYSVECKRYKDSLNVSIGNKRLLDGAPLDYLDLGIVEYAEQQAIADREVIRASPEKMIKLKQAMKNFRRRSQEVLGDDF